MLFHTELLYLLKITDKNKIMILTDEAKLDFERWLYSNDVLIKDGIYDDTYLTDVFEELPLNLQYSSIIEWFDSVGICIDRDCINMEMVITDFKDVKEKQTIIDCGLEEPFPDWWKKAIKKANEIYNSTL